MTTQYRTTITRISVPENEMELSRPPQEVFAHVGETQPDPAELARLLTKKPRKPRAPKTPAPAAV